MVKILQARHKCKFRLWGGSNSSCIHGNNKDDLKWFWYFKCDICGKQTNELIAFKENNKEK